MIAPISVVVPAFNAEKYIVETLDSIKAQTVKPKLVIVVDDGSTDNTRQIVEEYSQLKKYPLQLLSNKFNCGIGKTRQRGVTYAKTDYVAFLSSDDCYTPDFIEKCLPYLKENTATYTSYFRCDSNLKPQAIFQPPVFSRKSVVDWALKKNMYVNFSSVIFPKIIFNKVVFEGALKHGEDLIFLLDTVKANLNYTLVSEPLLFYRIHNLAGTFTQKPEEFYLLWRFLEQRLKFMDVPEKQIKHGYKVSKNRSLPSFQRRLVSRAYHSLFGFR